jgi:hypothetical protein
MKFNQSIRILIAVAIALVIAVPFTVELAQAAKCLSGWRLKDCRTITGDWGANNSGSGSCLSVVTKDYYEFRVRNATGGQVPYQINGENFVLYAGHERNHRYPKALGSNSCNVRHYESPVIKFDFSYQAGYQERSYAVGTNPIETFRSNGYGLDLVH